MAEELFNPFLDLTFDEHFCFLTGALTNEEMTVYPDWLMDHFKLRDEQIEMMDKSKSYNYSDLKLPVSLEVKNAFEALDSKFKAAFDKGYEGMKALDEHAIFLWTGRIVYGMLYYEMIYERDRLLRLGKEFKLSIELRKRFSYFHLMLQSLVEPVYFKERKPWSIAVFQLKYSADILSFRNDSVNLLFQFGVNGFGFIVCLQDNGVIGEEQKEILDQIEGKVLHPVQFEELYARFHFTDYIMKKTPQYEIEPTDDGLFIEALPLESTPTQPVFGFWDEDTFAQLLSNYWQVYGIEKEDIIQFQKPRLSFLIDPYSLDLIEPDSIKLPY